MATPQTQTIIDNATTAVASQIAEATALRNKISTVVSAKTALQDAYDTLVEVSNTTQSELQAALTTTLGQKLSLEAEATQLGIDVAALVVEEATEEAARIAAEAAVSTANASLQTANDDLAAALAALGMATSDLLDDDAATSDILDDDDDDDDDDDTPPPSTHQVSYNATWHNGIAVVIVNDTGSLELQPGTTMDLTTGAMVQFRALGTPGATPFTFTLDSHTHVSYYGGAFRTEQPAYGPVSLQGINLEDYDIQVMRNGDGAGCLGLAQPTTELSLLLAAEHQITVTARPSAMVAVTGPVTALFVPLAGMDRTLTLDAEAGTLTFHQQTAI